MATFVSIHKGINFFDMQFVNGRFETDDPKEIKILSSVEAQLNSIVRLDNSSEKKVAVAPDDSKEEAKTPKKPKK